MVTTIILFLVLAFGISYAHGRDIYGRYEAILFALAIVVFSVGFTALVVWLAAHAP